MAKNLIFEKHLVTKISILVTKGVLNPSLIEKLNCICI
jgi:hypothetical protein